MTLKNSLPVKYYLPQRIVEFNSSFIIVYDNNLVEYDINSCSFKAEKSDSNGFAFTIFKTQRIIFLDLKNPYF